MKFELQPVSSLEKVFADEPLSAPLLEKASALRGEVFSFQLAYWCDLPFDLAVKINSPLNSAAEIRETALAPCELPAEEQSEEPDLLRTVPGLYPDPLLPISGKIKIPPDQWRTVWITLRVAADEATGRKNIICKANASAIYTDERLEAVVTVELDILPALLPEQKLIHTEWFHTDCISSFYKMKCWSEAHWALLDKYISNFVRHGINMLLTPLWTPPLDTLAGGERPTVQLLDIEKTGNTYKFDFSRLGRWIDLGLKNGVEYFEMAHPFTQWGAAFCPKIIVRENGRNKKLFGWHTASRSEEYVSFLRQLFPRLLAFLDTGGVRERCFYHVSDEPELRDWENYHAGAELIRELAAGAPVIDAVSNIEFYRKGSVLNPIPGIICIEPFVEAGVRPLWTYYCNGHREKVPNRLFNFPSYRNRVLGILMYKYDIYGFLQWGFNFWYSRYSVNQKLDPFKSTDAGRAFASGDAFMVYPGKNGPIDSIRNEVMFEALQDLRALRRLEELQGRDETLTFIHAGLDYELKMTAYPHSAAWLLGLRERINRRITELTG
ncbi:MAG: DUF4091 domain-containing protein [Victivallaceae bacterium]|nr:DUF4091 domain-containing protein [Victivallaceae bacterium]